MAKRSDVTSAQQAQWPQVTQRGQGSVLELLILRPLSDHLCMRGGHEAYQTEVEEGSKPESY